MPGFSTGWSSNSPTRRPPPSSSTLLKSCGRTDWDFTFVEQYKTSKREIRERRPFKQNKLAETRGKTFIPTLRAAYAKIVNRTMQEAGLDVRYDPRSSADMGLNQKPMQNVKRIVMDKAAKQGFTVMDEDWTRRQINREIERAALEREESFVRLSDIEKDIRSTGARYQAMEKFNERLPKNLKVNPKDIQIARHEQLLAL
jgi:hypothetical protein